MSVNFPEKHGNIRLSELTYWTIIVKLHNYGLNIVIEDLPDVPPALVLILQEMASQDSWVNMRRRIKEMLPDLRDQSEAYQIHTIEESHDDKKYNHFDIHLHPKKIS